MIIAQMVLPVAQAIQVYLPMVQVVVMPVVGPVLIARKAEEAAQD